MREKLRHSPSFFDVPLLCDYYYCNYSSDVLGDEETCSVRRIKGHTNDGELRI